MTTKTLPDTLSGLLRVALGDLEKAKKDKENYRINMGEWHSSSVHIGNHGKCEVCLAGSVLAFTLGANVTSDLMPDCGDLAREFGISDDDAIKLESKLLAINDLRVGSVSCAVNQMQCIGLLMEFELQPILVYDRDVVFYEDDPRKFKRDMQQLLKDLEAAGL